MADELDNEDDENPTPGLDGLDHLDEDAPDAPEAPAAPEETPAAPAKPAAAAPNADWQAALAELSQTVGKAIAPKEEPQRPPTQEEINAHWGVWDPTKENPRFIEEFFGLPEDADPKLVEAAKKRFAALQTNLVRQSIIGAQRVIAKEFEARDARLAPVEEFVSEARARETRENFFKTYEPLAVKDEAGNYKYAKVLELAAKDLANETFSPGKAGEKEYFKALAERAAEVLAGVGHVIDLKSKTKPSGSTPRLPRTRVGGTGGVGGGAAVGAISVRGDATDEFLED